MKRTNKQNRLFQLFLSLVLIALTMVVCMVTASAADLEWNLLTDTEAGYRVERRNRAWVDSYEEDGTLCVKNEGGKVGALYIYDDQNILGSYLTFSLEGDFYFESFPEGIRDGKYTPEQKPLSLLSWNYKDLESGKTTQFNSIRIDGEGYLHTKSDGSERTDIKLEVGRWYNIRCVFTPKNGLSEMFIDGKKVLDFSIIRFDTNKYASDSVRYFDGYYNWGVKMKNLIVKTDSDYTIDLKRESAADYLGYQATKAENGSFAVRAVFGVNSTDFNRVGYEALILSKDEDGNILTDARSLRVKEIYETLTDSEGNVYNIKELYDYNYAAALEIDDLPQWPTGDYFELVLRPYVLGMDGIRRYGVAATLQYTCYIDENGYPVLTAQSDRRYAVTATDDTYIYNGQGQATANYGSAASLVVRNPGNEDTNQFRAAYFKFTFDTRMVKALESATAAKLRIYIKNNETGMPSRKQYEMIVNGVGTDWTESELNFNNYQTLAPTYEELGRGEYQENNYFILDVLSYINEQMLNEDGTLTVAFRLINEGHNDTIAVWVNSKESGYAPTIEIENSMYQPVLNLSKSVNVGYEPWGYAEHLVDEWFDVLVDEIYPKDENGNVIYHDEFMDFAPDGYNQTEATGDFTREVTWKQNALWSTNASTGYKVADSTWVQERFMRTLSTLGTSTAVSFLETDLGEIIAEHDIYGGITNAGFTGEATGFFHTEKIGKRTYIIDPLGNPYFALGINTITLGDSENHKTYSIQNYGLEEVYFERITKELKEAGINLAATSTHGELLKVQEGLPCLVSISIVGAYMRTISRPQISEGKYPFNNTINVFDPDFVKVTNENVATAVIDGGYADMPYIFGYTSDNELPSGDDILTRYLTLDPNEEPTNGFSYAVAWTWLARRMGTDCPTMEEYYASPELLQMNEEFLCFIYSRYYRVASEAIDAVDPNHMYLGSRVNGVCREREGYLRAAGRYLDILSVNLYGGLNPSLDMMRGMYRYSGIPFLVTEFFAKGMDSIDANGHKLANSTGAGILVETQKDRADYYEHYALTMLESGVCVGWTWYRYRDNDQSIYTTDGENRLIMLHMEYGVNAHANTFMDLATGEILPAAKVGKLTTVYKGEALASNQNVNKGLYNSNFSSVVSVYTYDANGKLIDSMSYEVEHPKSNTLIEGDLLFGKNGEVYTVGTVENDDGGTTETLLTAYKGQYVLFAKAIRNISDHLIGILNYFED